MSSPDTGIPSKMRANRSVVETKCLTCGQGFTFGEEVCACKVCGGYHHAACWNLAPICQHNVAGSTVNPPPAPPVPPQPAAPPVQGGRPMPADDEQYCMQCGKIIKKDALKCRYCGYILSSQLAAQEISPAKQAEIDKAASTAMWCGIIGLFICGPILGSIAISQANKALREIEMAPQYSGPKGRATAGRVLGIIAWVFFAIFLIVRLSNIR